MDNLTHGLTGWNLARLYPEEWGAWVTPTAILAANLPDLEVAVVPMSDKPYYLMWHRVWSHCLVGVALELAALTLVLSILAWYGRNRFPALSGLNWRRVLVVAVPAAASHLFMDWWNSYGIQPLYPFIPTRIYGDMVFIIDPWLWLLLGSGVVLGTNLQRLSRLTRAFVIALGGILLTLCSLVVIAAVQSELVPSEVAWLWFCWVGIIAVLRFTDRVSSRKSPRWFAATALIVMCGYVSVLGGWSHQAKQLALREFQENYAANAPPVVKTSANPLPAIPWRYEVLVDTGSEVYQFSSNSLWRQTVLNEVHPTHRDLPELSQFEETPQVKAWRAFARHPIVRKSGSTLHLGDVRYQLSPNREDWSEQTIEMK